MGGECQYFNSGRWQTHIWNHLNSLETIDTFLDKYTKQEDIEEQLQRLQSHLGLTASELRDEPIEHVLRQAAPVLDIEVDSVPEIWQEIHGFASDCPHDIHEDGDCCLLHATPATVSDQETIPFLTDCLNPDTQSSATVAGVSVERLDLNRIAEEIGPSEPLNLRFIDVGTLVLPDGSIEAKIDLRGSSIGTIEGANRTVLGRIDLSGARVHDAVDCQNSVFHQKFIARQADLNGCNFRDVTFQKRADFEGARFRSATSFKHAVFQGRGYFKSAHLDSVDFKRAVFRGKASFKRARITGSASFPRVQFGGKASFKYARFGGDADFEVTSFDREARFWDVRFHGSVQFIDAEFDDIADFSLARFSDETADPQTVYFNRAEFTDTILFNAVECPSGAISFAEATLRNGRISQPESSQNVDPVDSDRTDSSDHRVYYDLAEATVGDVELLPRDDRDLFTYFKIDRTEFDGFDFGAHRNLLSRRWDNLHRYVGPALDTSFSTASRDKFRVSPDPYETETTRAEQLEETYLKAKTGAVSSGDSKTASEFFLREMRYRRINHYDRMWESAGSWYSGIVSAGRWSGSWLFRLTCGYGERPSYTLGTSVVVVLGFTAVYATLGVGGDALSTLVDYGSFSLQVFVALVLGESMSGLDRWATLISSLEAFIGAFLIALFVFALTRSVHR